MPFSSIRNAKYFPVKPKYVNCDLHKEQASGPSGSLNVNRLFVLTLRTQDFFSCDGKKTFVGSPVRVADRASESAAIHTTRKTKGNCGRKR